MNYYEHHIGDFAQATAHLSFVEDAAYSRLIRKYYAEEKPLPVDLRAVQRLVGARTKEERQAVDDVLQEFFTLEPDGWHNKRCDEEIARYQEKQQKARDSAKARWDKRAKSDMRMHEKCDANASNESASSDTEIGKNKNNFTGDALHQSYAQTQHKTTNVNKNNGGSNANAMRTQSEGNAHQTPDTRHQEKSSALLVDGEKGTARGAMAKELRASGVNVTPSHPLLVEWVDRGVTIALAQEAVLIARDRKPAPQPIAAAYLAPIIDELVNRINGKPKAGKATSQALDWWRSAAGIEAKAVEVDVSIPRNDERPSGEYYDGLRCAIAAKIGPGPWVDPRNGTEMRLVRHYEKAQAELEGERT